MTSQAKSEAVQPLLLKVSDVAAALSWGHSKTWRYIAEGRIPSVKSDGSRRVRRSDLETFVATLPTWPEQ